MSTTLPNNSSSLPARGLLTDLAGSPSELLEQPISREGWAKIAILGVLFLGLNSWQFPNLYYQWMLPNWQHGWAIPAFALLMLFLRRHDLMAAPRDAGPWSMWLGVAVIFLGMVAEAGGVIIGTRFISGAGMIITLLGLVWCMCGWSVLVRTAVPIMFLIFAIPLPDTIYKGISFPLQNFAAGSASSLLAVLGVRLEVSASAMNVWGQGGQEYHLTVEEACIGIRSMMAFMALGVVFAYLEERPAWQRIVLVLIIIPVAIFVNVLRVMITAGMFVIDKPDLGRDFMHEFTGLLMLIPAALIMGGIWWVLKKIYTEEEEDQEVVLAPVTESAPAAPSEGGQS